MKWVNTLRRLTMRGIHAAILSSALLGSASMVAAQTPGTAAAKLPKQHFTRSQSFDLPVVMDQELRNSLSEIRLYVRTPGTSWKLQETIQPSRDRFSCKVAQDGEYWFSLVTVDRMGRMTPADVNLEPPSQRVVVDTTPPVIAVQAANHEADFCLRCTVQDENPDHGSLKAMCKTDLGDVPLEMIAGQPGVFRIKGSEMMRFPVIVSAKDLAGNVATKEVNVRDMIASLIAPSKGDGAQKSGSVRTEDPPVKVGSGFPPPPPPLTGTGIPHQDPIKVPTLPTETTQRAGVPHQLINTIHAAVDYRIDQVGPSGVGKVEIYMTPDNGQTWHRVGEDVAKRSPAEIKLPGDGVFGIRMVVSNGNGFGGRPPVRGDAPHCTIEVDTTSPFVQIRSAELLPSSGQVEIRWNATDKNLGTEPVTLYYRTRLDGPWQLVAKNVKNDGVHRWTFPRDAGNQFFFKVEVTDLAGNMSSDMSRQPLVLDMSEPRATVVGVTGGGTVRTVGGGQ